MVAILDVRHVHIPGSQYLSSSKFAAWIAFILTRLYVLLFSYLLNFPHQELMRMIL